MTGPVTPCATPPGEDFRTELQVRAAEASTAAQAAELLGDDLQVTIASSDLADLRSIAARNDVELEDVVLAPEVRDQTVGGRRPPAAAPADSPRSNS